MIEADYRMKLVGMGLEEGVPGVKSYLKAIELQRGETPPPMNVLRWWFTLRYQTIAASSDYNGFEIRGPGVQVLSESEHLTQQGRRVHTGQADELTRQFSSSFSKHYEQLSRKYPIYADLRNIFDLAIVVALIDSEELTQKTHWSGKGFLDNKLYPIELAAAPKEVESVINHRVFFKKHIVAGVSGGVAINPSSITKRKAMQIEKSYGTIASQRHPIPINLRPKAWWWDADLDSE